MKLYINGQDIKKLVLADVDKEDSLFVHEGEPETFLKAIVEFLVAAKKELRDVQELYAVVGPGSATSLRAVVTIANTLAFATGVHLFGLTKDEGEQDLDSVRAIMDGTQEFVSSEGMLDPFYAQAPHITASARDALKRKLHS